MGLSSGQLILGAGVICGSKRKASGMTDIVRQNENICMKKMKKMYCIIGLFTY